VPDGAKKGRFLRNPLGGTAQGKKEGGRVSQKKRAHPTKTTSTLKGFKGEGFKERTVIF